jgi:cyanuric acid amidohydrolase
MSGPADTAAVERELDRQGVSLDRVRGVMCMTEGDGLARAYGSLAFSDLFADRLGWDRDDVPNRVPQIMIGGCTGLVSPYAALFVEVPEHDAPSQEGGLAIGITTTAAIDIEAFGTLAMVDQVAESVRAAMADAGIEDAADVHCVQIKAPWPTTPELEAAARDGRSVATTSGDRAGGLARAAGALGVAVALGEIDRTTLRDGDIAGDLSLNSAVASASAGSERTDVAVIVMGNAKGSSSPYRIGHGVMRDGIDVSGVHQALASAGFEDSDGGSAPRGVDHVFVKSAVDLSGECRGRRHVLQTDYLAPYSWLLAKAVIHATVASVVGDPLMQVSGGGEHQGPPGGGLVAIVREVSPS